MRRIPPFATLLGAVALAVGVGFLLPALPLAAFAVAATLVLVGPGAYRFARNRDGTGLALALAGAGLAPLVTGVTHVVTHPLLHVDNASSEPIELWVDGVRTMVVPPTPQSGEPPRIRLPYGAHRLGYARPGAPVGMHEIEVELTPRSEHLYNPGTGGCYWLQATAYGDASTHGFAHGPQALQEFHRFAAVDVWFADNPQATQAPRIQSGRTKVAIQRHAACMELAALGCTLVARDEFVRCETTTSPLAEPRDCFAEAAKTCRAAIQVDAKKP